MHLVDMCQLKCKWCNVLTLYHYVKETSRWKIGRVFPAIYRGNIVAVKHYENKTNQEKNAMFREIVRLNMYRCPHIVSLYGAGPNVAMGNLQYIVMDGDTRNYLKNSRSNLFPFMSI